MTPSVLAKLFGSADRLKVIRLFLLNPEEIFRSKDISKRAKINPRSLRRETSLLSSIGLICKKKSVENGKKTEGWSLDALFPLLNPLKDLVLEMAPLSKTNFLHKIKRVGHIKLVVLAGIFIKDENSRVDILVVGDKIRKTSLDKILKEVEAEIGKELSYAIFATDDFLYRLNIYDKFIRDILDYPHQKIMDKIGLN